MCVILFKPSCCGTEYRVCHGLTHVYTYFYALLPLYRWIPSFSDFLSLLFLAQSYSSTPPELGVTFFVFIMHLEYTLHWPCHFILYCSNTRFLYQCFRNSSQIHLCSWHIKCTKQTYWIYVSGNRRKKLGVCCQCWTAGKSISTSLIQSKDFVHEVKFQESFKRWKKKNTWQVWETEHFCFQSDAWETV